MVARSTERVPEHKLVSHFTSELHPRTKSSDLGRFYVFTRPHVKKKFKPPSLQNLWRFRMIHITCFQLVFITGRNRRDTCIRKMGHCVVRHTVINW